ncbi:MAG: hypothetical protein DRO12_06595 [Thermoprotei archaeon]|nr:MAG: hypothetical protein DRO12_06595 [Thermoprotei archaeon]
MTADGSLELIVDGASVKGVAIFNGMNNLIAYWPPYLTSTLPKRVAELAHVLAKPGDYLIAKLSSFEDSRYGRDVTFALLKTRERLFLLILSVDAPAEALIQRLQKIITDLRLGKYAE